jgi:Capsular polysaccharide biosynthesis protein
MNPDVYPDESEAHFRQVYDSFVPLIPEELGVKTSLAAEYMVVPDFEQRAAHPESLLTWPDGSILIEMSYFFRSNNLEQTLFELNMAGLNPILAHPERYLYMVKSLKDFEKFQDMGCRFQMNFASATGKYGPDSVKILSHLLDHGMYSFIATDLHSNMQLESLIEGSPVRKIRRSFEKFLQKIS